MHSGYSDKPINGVQSLSRKSIRMKPVNKIFFQYVAVVKSITPMGKIVNREFTRLTHERIDCANQNRYFSAMFPNGL